VFEAFAPDEEMRIYGRGIRRRLASMLEGDRDRIELAYSLLFSLPGTPLLIYGDEIGMGDDLSLPGRNPVRTPMQWSDEPNAGFSDADPQSLVRPVISGGKFGYESVNVADQRGDPDSLLQWFSRLNRLRGECPEIGHGVCEILPTDDPAVFAHRMTSDHGSVAAVHNLADEDAEATLELPTEPVALFDGEEFERVGGDAGGAMPRRVTARRTMPGIAIQRGTTARRATLESGASNWTGTTTAGFGSKKRSELLRSSRRTPQLLLQQSDVALVVLPHRVYDGPEDRKRPDDRVHSDVPEHLQERLLRSTHPRALGDDVQRDSRGRRVAAHRQDAEDWVESDLVVDHWNLDGLVEEPTDGSDALHARRFVLNRDVDGLPLGFGCHATTYGDAR
jgi:hypothetical protein